MAEEQPNQGNTPEGNTPPEPNQGNTPPDTAKEIATLKREAAERRVTAEKLQAKLDEIAAAEEENKKKLAEEQGEFKTLYEQKEAEVVTLTERAETAEAALENFLEAELEGIDEDKQGLIPELSAAEKLAWLAKAKKAGMFGKPEKQIPDIKPNADPKNIDLSAMSPVEKANYARSQKK